VAPQAPWRLNDRYVLKSGDYDDRSGPTGLAAKRSPIATMRQQT